MPKKANRKAFVCRHGIIRIPLWLQIKQRATRKAKARILKPYSIYRKSDARLTY